jgi:hypothetical protein
MKKSLTQFAGLLLVAFVVLPPAASAVETRTPPRSDRSYYLAMRDGVRVAVNLYYPAGAEPEFHDDAGKNGPPLFASSPGSHLANIRAEKKPAQVWGSRVDGGTAPAAIARYNSTPEVPMELWITAISHPNTVLADPFVGQEDTPMPGLDTFDISIGGETASSLTVEMRPWR